MLWAEASMSSSIARLGLYWEPGIPMARFTMNEESSDGLYFTDAKTGKLIRIAGTFIVTQN